MNRSFLNKMWGGAAGLLDRSRRFGWVDLVLLVGIIGLIYGLREVAGSWSAKRDKVEIDLSLWALPRYTFYSLSRGLIAYALSLLFTLVYGYWAAKDRTAERVLVPMLDILQSIPVLTFMPGFVFALVALFPNSNIGLELAAILMIFTGQAWNMTFSFYHSVRAVPNDLSEAATVYRFTWWRRFCWVELPASMVGLVWNSMMSMAGGWFFLMLSEQFDLGPGRDFRLEGIGSYMGEAVKQQDTVAMVGALVAMTLMIIGLDQLLWRPVVVWAQKFRVEEGAALELPTSWFLDWLRRSRLIGSMGRLLGRLRGEIGSDAPPMASLPDPTKPVAWAAWLSILCFLSLLSLLTWGGFELFKLLIEVPVEKWGELILAGGWTLGRVLIAVTIGTLWALPAGLAIGLSPRLSRIFQPIVQVVASFPAPMLFPLVLAGMTLLGVSLGWTSILLMLLGTQWYILFNVIAGAMAIPADLKEATRSYGIRGWQRFWALYLPAIFPTLVTGWVTATGGAWNASIVAEFIADGAGPDQPLKTYGLGAEIMSAFADKPQNFRVLAAGSLIMALIVVTFNRTVWRYCYNLAESRYSMNR